MSIQEVFVSKAKQLAEADNTILGLAVTGSWLTNELDAYSDVDLILITKEKVAGDKQKMLAYAAKFGSLLSGFTGEHVGEPRVLICLYNGPLLHVDIKFLIPEELGSRIEDPYWLVNKSSQIKTIIAETTAVYPTPNFQWLEDRFWIWVHYALLKIGRGENFEAHDMMAYLRGVVLGPMLQVKNGKKARGIRKVEVDLAKEDLQALQQTLCSLQRESLLNALMNAVTLYRLLRKDLFNGITLQAATEASVMTYFDMIQNNEL